MTLGDLLKRVDIEKDRDKMIILSDGIGWTNIGHVNTCGSDIIIYNDTSNGPFSSDK